MTALRENQKRTILCNHCENWILKWEKYYGIKADITCLPCVHYWEKTDQIYRQARTNILFQISDKNGYRYLEPIEAPSTLTNRCCTEIMLEYGKKVAKPLYAFPCPVCQSRWSILENSQTGTVYINEFAGLQFTREECPTGDYLRPLVT